MAYTPTVWTKNGITRTAYTPAEAVQYKYDGWQLVGDGVYPPPAPVSVKSVNGKVGKEIVLKATDLADFEVEVTAKIASGVGETFDSRAAFIDQAAQFAGADGAGLTSGPDWSRWLGFGSSTINGLLSRLTTLATSYGATYVDGSGSGQCAEQILARLGSRPMRTGGFVNIPASGSVVVASSNVSATINAAVSYAGYFDGFPSIHGTMSKATGYQSGYTFTRDASGSAQAIPLDTKFIPDTASRRNAVAILNVGKNNMTATPGGTSNVDTVIGWEIDAANWLNGKGHPVLVLGHFVDTNTPAVSAIRDRITKRNTTLAARFGSRFLDVSALLTSPDVWAATGITPTTDDLAQQALGNKPPSLSSDDLHLNTPGNNVLRDAIATRVTALGWKAEPASLASVLAASFRGDDIAGADGVDVTSWVSRAGTISGLTLAPVINAPELNINGLSTHKTVIFDGSGNSEALHTPASSMSLTTATYVLVARVLSTTGAMQTLLSGDASGWQRIYTNSPGTSNYISGSSSNEVMSTVVTAIAGWQIVVARFNAASSDLRVNGASTVGTVSASTQTRIRLAVNAGGTSARGNIEVAALDIYSTALTDDQVTQAVQQVVADVA